MIHPFFQFLPAFEKWKLFGFDRDDFSGFRVSTIIGPIFFDSKSTKSPDFNPITACKCGRHFIETDVYNRLSFLFCENFFPA